MSAHPIEWHKECLKNMQASLYSDEARIARQREDACRLSERVWRYGEQIERAEMEGRAAFDAERFGVKRTAKVKAREVSK